MNEPGHPGLYVFKGIRYTAMRREVVNIHEIVEVQVGLTRRQGKTLVVAFMGRGMKYPLELFEGDWRPVRLKSLLAESEKEAA